MGINAGDLQAPQKNPTPKPPRQDTYRSDPSGPVRCEEQAKKELLQFAFYSL
jgi:hypothetical protein